MYQPSQNSIKKAGKPRIEVALWVLVYLLVAIGIAVVVRRAFALKGIAPASNRFNSAAVDAGFSKHPVITWLHILPGLLFMVLGPLQFMPRLRARNIRLHRWSGRVFLLCGYMIGFSALVMPFVMTPIGGISEAAATTFYALVFLVSLSMAWWSVLHKRITKHRQWMIRAFAIGLAVATIRPIVALFFIFSGLPPQLFFGTAFWIGFTLHLIAAEAWIWYTQASSPVPKASYG